jgi:hypothetical protein
MEGYTLAMDFPATPANLALLARLDAITAEHGGRVYLTKDACTTPAAVARGYPQAGGVPRGAAALRSCRTHRIAAIAPP